VEGSAHGQGESRLNERVGGRMDNKHTKMDRGKGIKKKKKDKNK